MTGSGTRGVPLAPGVVEAKVEAGWLAQQHRGVAVAQPNAWAGYPAGAVAHAVPWPHPQHLVVAPALQLQAAQAQAAQVQAAQVQAAQAAAQARAQAWARVQVHATTQRAMELQGMTPAQQQQQQHHHAQQLLQQQQQQQQLEGEHLGSKKRGRPGLEAGAGDAVKHENLEDEGKEGGKRRRLTSEERLNRSRERNKMHARKTRQRKKLQLQHMQLQVQELLEEQRQLQQALKDRRTANIMVGMAVEGDGLRDSPHDTASDTPIKEEMYPEGQPGDRSFLSGKMRSEGGNASGSGSGSGCDSNVNTAGSDLGSEDTTQPSESGTDLDQLKKEKVDCTPEGLEKIRRERNRLHAKRTRDRKRLFLEETETSIARLEEQNKRMREEIEGLVVANRMFMAKKRAVQDSQVHMQMVHQHHAHLLPQYLQRLAPQQHQQCVGDPQLMTSMLPMQSRAIWREGEPQAQQQVTSDPSEEAKDSCSESSASVEPRSSVNDTNSGSGEDGSNATGSTQGRGCSVSDEASSADDDSNCNGSGSYARPRFGEVEGEGEAFENDSEVDSKDNASTASSNGGDDNHDEVTELAANNGNEDNDDSTRDESR